MEQTATDALVEKILSGNYKNVIVMTGAGISTAAGIPDFRSPKIGLYATLKEMQSLKFRSPTFVFDIGVFMSDPKPFWWIFNKLWPKNEWPLPTDMHYFISLLNEKGILLRSYTQNVDGLEIQAGLPDEKLIQCHGTLTSAHCKDCGAEVSFAECLRQVQPNMERPDNEIGDTVVPHCPSCGGEHVKPDVTFFGESLPPKFYRYLKSDFDKCDLLIVSGTALEVWPFAGLITHVKADVPRFVINLKPVKAKSGFLGRTWNFIKSAATLFLNDYNEEFEYGEGRDFFIGGDCQDAAREIIEKASWKEDFERIKAKSLEENRNPIFSASKGEEGGGEPSQ
jgi:NAD-dependent SIR2 family protein deacetylase